MNKQEEAFEARKEHIITKIKNQIPWVDIKEYSHNIITLWLGALETEYGLDEVKKLIRETRLKYLGWGWVLETPT